MSIENQYARHTGVGYRLCVVSHRPYLPKHSEDSHSSTYLIFSSQRTDAFFHMSAESDSTDI